MEALKQSYFFIMMILIPAVIGGWMAANRGRNVLLWTVLSALLPVLILILWFEGPVKEVPGKFRRCGHCNHLIPWKLKNCKYCGAEIMENKG